MGQWASLGSSVGSMAQSTMDILNTAGDMAQLPQTEKINDDQRRLSNLWDRNLLVSQIADSASSPSVSSPAGQNSRRTRGSLLYYG